ncbi:MAG: hypothetical protein LC745_05625, partial [Planctomycetia bacterium]|nr:hypothetical protein [Planctomycetia bacterium]
MSNLGYPFKFLTPVRDVGGRSPSHAGVRRHVDLETLEGRALLSHLGHHAAQSGAPTAAEMHIPRHPHPG